MGFIFENEDGYLSYKEIGGSATSFKVNTIKESQDKYIATVIQSVEESNETINVYFTVDNNKCVISSYKLNN